MKHGKIGLGQDLARNLAKDELAQPASRIAALDEEVGAQNRGRIEQAAAGELPAPPTSPTRAGTPCRRRLFATCSSPGPGSAGPGTVRTTTSCARFSRGMAKAMLRAVSVVPFQAIAMRSPSVAGGRGGAIRTGRPLSKRTASRVDAVAFAARPAPAPRTGWTASAQHRARQDREHFRRRHDSRAQGREVRCCGDQAG